MKKQNWEAKQGKDATHKRGRACICVLHQVKPTPKQLCHAYAWQPSPSSPRICLVDQQAHTRPTHMRDSDIVKPQSSTHRRRRSTHMRGRHPGSKQPRMTYA
ncbi:hypothetical protein PIB30_104121 [Stylosanthes scabra]|uniref:Uncharacterized protein n=1 Tax=Stylosanthes scabra TaxID=79078 RepID=A0ABU6QYK6_9FABA|nr:hypothetical protein [Stylosanthes scabra]